jgi:ferrous iron transport protein A
MQSTLETLRPRQNATILSVEAGEALYHRLAALGLRIGKQVCVLRRAPFGGPIQIRVGMTEIMLRVTEARCVRVVPEPKP